MTNGDTSSDFPNVIRVQDRRIQALEDRQNAMKVDFASHKAWAETMIEQLHKLNIDMQRSMQELTRTIAGTQNKVALIMGGCSAAVVFMQIIQILMKG